MSELQEQTNHFHFLIMYLTTLVIMQLTLEIQHKQTYTDPISKGNRQ